MLTYSVVIPVYNAEKTIERCLNSILNQPIEDFEIIAVDDGSSDRSPEILDQYQIRYENISVIHQKNSGVSVARNTGIKHSKGRYLLFVDSDDYVTEDYFSVIKEFGTEDLVVFAKTNIQTEQTDLAFFESLEKTVSFSELLVKLILGRKMLPPWNKRFKRSIINKYNIFFGDTFVIGEDFDFCMQYVKYCRTIAVSPNSIYRLDISDSNSLSRKYRPELDKKLSDVYTHIEAVYSRCSNRHIDKNKILSAVDFLFVRNLFACILEEFKNDKTQWFNNRHRYYEILNKFHYRVGKRMKYVNMLHLVFRILIKLNLVFPFYIVCYAEKIRRKF